MPTLRELFIAISNRQTLRDAAGTVEVTHLGLDAAPAPKGPRPGGAITQAGSIRTVDYMRPEQAMGAVTSITVPTSIAWGPRSTFCCLTVLPIEGRR